jgi:DUF4097 and DUF4098 domain-containing protein YvlB
MAGYPPPYPPPPGPTQGPRQGPPTGQDWRYQRRILREQARAQRDLIRAQRGAYRAQIRGSRRGSIVGPLLVVTIGVLFFLVQLGRLSFYQLGHTFGRFWPLLLVLVGVVLIIEWAVDRATAQRNGTPLYYRPSVGGGVISLLIIIAVVGVGASGIRDGRNNLLFHGFGLNQDNVDQFFGDKHESDQIIEQVYPANAALSVTNPRGDVTVSGISGDNQIHLTIHKQVYTRSDSDADSRFKDLAPRISTTSSTFDITMPSLEGTHADLTLTVPSGTPTTITANHGDAHVNSIKAPVSVTANHGDVELNSIDGPATTRVNNGSSSFSAHAINGPVVLEGHGRDLTLSDINGPVTLSGEFFGTTHLEHVRGFVKFHTSRTDFQLARLDGEIEISPGADLSASEAVGPVILTTRNRNITLEHISGDLSVTNRNGSVDLIAAPPLGNVTIANRSGSVNVTVPQQANFVVQAQTNNGDLENDFSLPTQENNNNKNFSGTVGKGGSLIRINTTEGDVALKKANLTPLPPLPPPPPPVPDSKNALNITSEDGSSVYIGKDGVRIISGPDGRKVIIGKDGLNITANSDGSSVYGSPSGTQLIESADGSKIYISGTGLRFTQNADGSIVYVSGAGTRYTKNADGSKSYMSPDGTRIALNADGTHASVGAGGKSFNDNQVRDKLRQAEDEIRRVQQRIQATERQRDADRKKALSQSN